MNEGQSKPLEESSPAVRAWVAAAVAVCLAAFIFSCAQYYGWLGFEGTKQLREESIAARKVIRD